MSDKFVTPIRGFVVYTVFASVIFAADLIFIFLRLFDVPALGEGNYVGILTGICIFVMYGMVRFFPFTMIDSKHGVYGILIPLISSLFIYILTLGGGRFSFVIAFGIFALAVAVVVVYYRKIYARLKNEGKSEYVVLELKAYKVFELNMTSMVLAAVFLAYVMVTRRAAAVSTLAGLGAILAVFGKVLRAKANRDMANIYLMLALEVICQLLSYTLIVVYRYVQGLNIYFVVVMSILLQVPGILLTFKINKKMKGQIYKD